MNLSNLQDMPAKMVPVRQSLAQTALAYYRPGKNFEDTPAARAFEQELRFLLTDVEGFEQRCRLGTYTADDALRPMEFLQRADALLTTATQTLDTNTSQWVWHRLLPARTALVDLVAYVARGPVGVTNPVSGDPA